MTLQVQSGNSESFESFTCFNVDFIHRSNSEGSLTECLGIYKWASIMHLTSPERTVGQMLEDQCAQYSIF